MSAYIVDKQHILYLVEAAMCRVIMCGSSAFRWYTNDNTKPGGYGLSELRPVDFIRAAEVANMLWMENIKSVSARYPNESSATLPGPRNQDFVVVETDFNGLRWDGFSAPQILKACDCLEYQSCEHEGWEASESKAFLDTLRKAAWHTVAGYEEAEWGCPSTLSERRAKYRKEAA